MARNSTSEEKVVDLDLVADAMAKAVAQGDLVNLRLLFGPSSPARQDSPEQLESPKYSYLVPEEEVKGSAVFSRALDMVRDASIWQHIRNELDAKRPAQLPWQLVLELADNAVRAGKYISAAQAYEMLRIRQRIQEEFLAQADAALGEGRLAKAVGGYIAAAGLEYDYSAFPEPLPEVPNHQTQALILHGEYPATPEDAVPMQDTETFLATAFSYLFTGTAVPSRLAARPVEEQVAVLKEYVRATDPEWDAFTARFREAHALVRGFGKQAGQQDDAGSLEAEIEAQRREDPARILELLVGVTLEEGEWWQYLKELAYQHPAAALFVARRVVGDAEILVPLYRPGSPAPRALGLDAHKMN